MILHNIKEPNIAARWGRAVDVIKKAFLSDTGHASVALRKQLTPSITQLQPSLLQPLHTHRLGCAQLLREEAHAQLFQ